MWTLRALLLVVVLAGCAEDTLGPDIGGRCQSNSECSQRCLPHNDYPGGFCTLACDDDRGCTRGAICMAREGGVCLFPCAAEAECAFLGQGWVCEVLSSKTGEPRQRGVCIGRP